MTVIRRRAADFHRKESTQQGIKERLAQEAIGQDGRVSPPLPREADDPEEADGDPGEPFIVEPKHWHAIKEALPDLPERQREVIRMRLFDKLSTAEISERWGYSENAACMA